MSLWRNQREFPPRDRTQVDQIIEVKPFGQMLSEVYVLGRQATSDDGIRRSRSRQKAPKRCSLSRWYQRNRITSCSKNSNIV